MIHLFQLVDQQMNKKLGEKQGKNICLYIQMIICCKISRNDTWMKKIFTFEEAIKFLKYPVQDEIEIHIWHYMKHKWGCNILEKDNAGNSPINVAAFNGTQIF